MISSFYHRKSKFDRKEDSLTATIFDLLKYLPSEIFWNILRNSLYHQKLPKYAGEIQSISFWEKWSVKDKDELNSNYIEPDVFIRFEDFDLIIEAKRYDLKQQCKDQLKSQINAYYLNFEKDSKTLYYIQLGGLLDFKDESHTHSNRSKKEGKLIMILKTDWTRILSQVVREKDRLAQLDYQPINAYVRILEDLIKGFELHGFYKKSWFEDLEINFDPSTISDKVAIYDASRRHG